MLGTKLEFTRSKNTYRIGCLRHHDLEYAQLILSATKPAFLREAASSNNSIHSEKIKLLRFAMHLYFPGDAWRWTYPLRGGMLGH